MPGGAILSAGPHDLNRVEAPVTIKTYMMCAFAAFGGILFGYDSGWVSGVLGMDYVIALYTGLPIPAADASAEVTAAFVVPAWKKSLVTSILSAGTFFGALIAGDLADWYGRRTTIISGCFVFCVGVALEIASHGWKLMVAGRLIAGFGVGFVSAIIILYMSEIAPRKVRGAIVSGYQFCVTIGLFLASIVDYATENRRDTGSYRIPVGIQFVWAVILGTGLFFLPESPRYFVRHGQADKAAVALARVRGNLDPDSDVIREELAEIIANHEYEMELIPATGYWASWAACFSGGLRNPGSNLRRTILGTSLQMMQQWTGVNFIFYFGTTFFQSLGTIHNSFLTTIITSVVNVGTTPFSFWAIERWGRRPLLIWGALGMLVCEFIVAAVGTALPGNNTATSAQVAFICIYIAFFATTWGPGAWVIIGEIFPIPIRSRGVALSTASNWLWNCIIAVITPYLVDSDKANLGSKVFFLWGGLCTLCFVYAYLFIWETKGLTLEQVDRMMEEVGSPRKSVGWVPQSTYAAEMGGQHAAHEKANAAHAEKAAAAAEADAEV